MHRTRPQIGSPPRTRRAASAAFALAAGAILATLDAAAAPQGYRRAVEADWERQEARRLALLRDPGTLRLPTGTFPWPGARPDPRRRVPLASPPALDGALDEPAWQQAPAIPPPPALGLPPPTATHRHPGPRFLLLHDGSHLHVAAEIPVALEHDFGPHFTSRDAAGAVDGVKNGSYGFHTGLETHPWWEVDLGRSQRISRLLVYNRLDYPPGRHNADRLVVLTSEDGKTWSRRHDNQGRPFGGATEGHPLTVELADSAAPAGAGGVSTRFVRLEVASGVPVFFHLDEVEVYSAADPPENVARGRPARQSSLSPWSRGGERGCALFTAAGLRVGLDRLSPGGVTVDGAPAPAGSAAVRQGGGPTTLEVSLPLESLLGRDRDLVFTPPGSEPETLALGGPAELAVKELSPLGSGRNRIALELTGRGPFTPPVEVRLESFVLTRRELLREALFQGAFHEPFRRELTFDITAEGPAALVATARWEGGASRQGRVFFVEPLRETLERARLVLARSARPVPKELLALESRAAALEARERLEASDHAARAALYLEARWLARRIAFGDPLLDFPALLFVQRFTQETYPDVCLNHMPWVSRPGGDLCILRASSGAGERAGLLGALAAGEAGGDLQAAVEVRHLLRGALGPGHVHGLDLSWDGERIVFGYARARSDEPPAGWLDRRESFRLRRSEEPIHLFEIRTDGTGLRQLTRGPWSDLDPAYLPDGSVAFVSERCAYSLQCNENDKDETSCNLYRLDPRCGTIHRLSATKDGDYLPHTLADGTLGYTRWEYQERGWAHIQSIWSVRPDGTGEDAVFKQHLNEPWALEDVRAVPASRKLLAVATGHHTLPAGPLVLVDPARGLNRPQAIRIVTPGVEPPEGGLSGSTVAEGGVPGRGGLYMTPWPLSEELFLASFTHGRQTEPAGYGLYLAGTAGTMELIWRDPEISCFSPIPLRPRPRPPVLPETTASWPAYATCVVSDVKRGVPGVSAAEVGYLRIAHRIPWPYDPDRGGHRYEPDVKQVMINWTPAKILGDVPVEQDGSAYFRVPADTPLYFQLLDRRRMELRRMRSFVSFQPGEMRSCSGCHETRAEAPAPAAFPLALSRPPSVPVPPPWGQRAVSFLRDVQPVLDRHCTRCHSGAEPAGGADLSGGLTARHNRAYDTILARTLVSRSNVGDDARVTAPRAFGSHRSRLLAALGEEPHPREVHLDEEDRLRLAIWIDANAPYHDGFMDRRPEHPPYDPAADSVLRERIEAVHGRRCLPCHGVAEVSRLDWIDIHEPRRTRFLAAPLAKEAGGEGRCRPRAGSEQGGGAVGYGGVEDPDYRLLLEAVERAVAEIWRRPRRDVRALEGRRVARGG